MIASTNTTAKNAMPLIGTIEKRDAGLLLSERRGMLHHMDGGEEAEDRHRGRERHAGDAERAVIDHAA